MLLYSKSAPHRLSASAFINIGERPNKQLASTGIASLQNASQSRQERVHRDRTYIPTPLNALSTHKTYLKNPKLTYHRTRETRSRAALKSTAHSTLSSAERRSSKLKLSSVVTFTVFPPQPSLQTQTTRLSNPIPPASLSRSVGTVISPRA